jgi:hypothetical protein
MESLSHLLKLLNKDPKALKALGDKWFSPKKAAATKVTDNDFDREDDGGDDRGQNKQGRIVWNANSNRGRGNGRGASRRVILKDTMREDLDELGIVTKVEKGNRRSNTGSIQCFKCNRHGHFARDCRN